MVAVGAVALTLTLRRNPGSKFADGLLPVTPDERRLYLAVAFTAGVGEELLFRGFLLLYLTGVLDWPWQGPHSRPRWPSGWATFTKVPGRRSPPGRSVTDSPGCTC